MPLLEVSNLEKTYVDKGVETPVLRGLSFKVEKGEFVAVMGPSGSGKSTLLHILGFLDRPTMGSYLFEGRRIESFSPKELAQARNRKMGFVFQSFHLLPRATVLDNVKLPLVYAELAEPLRTKRASEVIEAVGLSHRKFYQPSQLSGGEKQRVAIARALVNEPAVVFADEPTGNLDSRSGEIVIDLIKELNEKGGHTVILVTHETEIAKYAERLVRLRDGRIESDEPKL